MNTPPKRGMMPPTVKDTAEAIAACRDAGALSRDNHCTFRVQGTTSSKPFKGFRVASMR